MSAKPNGGPAFPRPAGKNGYPQMGYEDGNQGMTLRQWLAGMALQGFCANPNVNTAKTSSKSIAELCLIQADAVIAHEKGEA